MMIIDLQNNMDNILLNNFELIRWPRCLSWWIRIRSEALNQEVMGSIPAAEVVRLSSGEATPTVFPSEPV